MANLNTIRSAVVGAAALILVAVEALTCPGTINVSGYGRVALTNAQWNVPDEGAGIVDVPDGPVVRAHRKGRTYFADACSEGSYHNSRYASLRLLGKRMRYTTDLSGAGCGCNAALYLVSMRENEHRSQCSDYYCDANRVCGERCAEVDLQEANEHAWHSTIHAAADGSGVASGFGGGKRWNGPRDWGKEDFSPGSACIDTTKPINVEVSFPVKPDGSLQSMDVVLSQGTPPCNVSASVGEDYKGLWQVSEALDRGMTPVVSYWSSDQMLWMDGVGKDHKGACKKDRAKACTESVDFYGFAVEDLDGGAVRPAVQAPPATPAPAPEPSQAQLAAGEDAEAALPTRRPEGPTNDGQEDSEPHRSISSTSPYEFVGFAGPEHARMACGPGKRLVMPKTDQEVQLLREAMADALAAGRMSGTWPGNTIWLGAKWNNPVQRWDWDDSTIATNIPWGEGQPSANPQRLEPAMCMTADGKVHDAEALFSFGVICEPVEPDSSVDAEHGFCCMWGSSCDICKKRAGPKSWCGKTRSNCGSCGKVSAWCEHSKGQSDSNYLHMHVFMRKDLSSGESVDKRRITSTPPVVHVAIALGVLSFVSLAALVGSAATRAMRRMTVRGMEAVAEEEGSSQALVAEEAEIRRPLASAPRAAAGGRQLLQRTEDPEEQP